MNSKLLYAATLALSLASTLAMADGAPLTRAQVNAATQQAIATGTLRHTDYDDGSYRAQSVRSTVTREQVAAELAQSEQARKALVGPLADEKYNPYGTEVLEVSTLARSSVKADVREAAAAGTLQRTDYDDAATLARNARQHVAGEHFAQRLKARFAKSQG